MTGPRVVSLLPSATELLCAVGASDLLVGRSHECDWPPSIADRPVLTAQRTHGGSSAEIDAEVRASLAEGASLYTLDVERLAALAPDVILTQDLCDVCSIDLNTVRAVAARLPTRPTIVSLNPKGIFEVFDDVLTVGAAVGRDRDAEAAMVALRNRYWQAVDYVNPYVPGPEVLFLEWMDPPFVGGHWTPQLLENAGGRHSLNPPLAKSRQAAPEEILEAMPERVVICPCGFDLARIRAELPALRATRWWPLLPAVLSGSPGSVVMVDGNQMFNRPGPRLVDAFEWLVGWLNDRPSLIPPGFPVEALSS
ncbi:MAG: ABC transporter substrate-binding protein [Phycisphaerae bacterium]|nr:ABC transporter substrate-binding protein [Phycisphaerae bacterium]